MKHINLLLEVEKQRDDARLFWGRHNKTVIFICAAGYNPQKLTDVESKLLKLGCRHAFDYNQGFDPVSGTTTMFFEEPAEPKDES